MAVGAAEEAAVAVRVAPRLLRLWLLLLQLAAQAMLAEQALVLLAPVLAMAGLRRSTAQHSGRR